MTPETSLPPIAPVVAPPSTARKIFLSDQGLRAVWGVILFIAILAAFGTTAHFVSVWLRGGRPAPAREAEISLKSGFIQESLVVFMSLVATWIMARIERRGRSYGFGGVSKLPRFLAGLAWGVVMISLLVLTLWMSGLLVIDRRVIFGADVFRYGALWLIAFILVGVAEESISRGYLLYTMTRGLTQFYWRAFKSRHSAALGFWTAAVILSVIFFLGHTSNPGESPVGLLSVFVAGMFLCFSVWRSGSLWWAIGMHAAWDWGQSFLFGVADSGYMAQHHLLATHPQGRAVLSGGTTGPEGSIFVLVVMALGALIIVWTVPRNRYVDEPDQLQLPAPVAA